MPSPTSTFAKTRGRTWGARGQDAPERWGGLQATKIRKESLMPARRALSGPKRGRPDRTNTAGPLSTPGFVLVRVRSFGSGVSWRPPRVRPPRGLSPSQTESPKGREHREAGGGGVSDPSLIRRHDTMGVAPVDSPPMRRYWCVGGDQECRDLGTQSHTDHLLQRPRGGALGWAEENTHQFPECPVPRPRVRGQTLRAALD